VFFCSLVLFVYFVLFGNALAKETQQKAAKEKSSSSEEKPSVQNTPPLEPKIIPSRDSMCQEFTFDATASHDPDNEELKFFWDFGDGATSDQPIVTHTYEKTGTYKVTLTVTDNSGLACSSDTTSKAVLVNIAPEAVMEAPDKLCVGETAELDGSESFTKTGDQLKFRWDLGDGTKQEGTTIQKRYEKGGRYEVSLMVDDNAGTACSTDRVGKMIYVNEPPVADAGQDVVLQCLKDEKDLTIKFDASKSEDPNGDPLTYRWDFGDGTTGEGKTVTHQYQKTGKYKVELTVLDESGLSCNSSQDTVEVNLSRASKANAGEDISICLGDRMEFDGTGSYADPHEALFSKWDFGDGASERGLKVHHTYKKVGVYTATLTVENALSLNCPSSTDTRKITVNSAPAVSLSTSTKSACVDEEVSFDASSSIDPDGDSLEYFWSFGDETIIKGPSKVSHKFTQGGQHKVSVMVDDNKGSDCSSNSATVLVKVNTPPTVDAGPNLACCMDEETMFDGSSSFDADGDELTYVWDFGDGSKASAAKASHTYLHGGTYNVTLTVDDNTGSQCSSVQDGFVAQVNEKPVPVIKVK